MTADLFLGALAWAWLLVSIARAIHEPRAGGTR